METNKPAITGLKKRQQIQQANRAVFVWATIAAAVVAIAVVVSQFLYKEFMFNNRIIGDLTATNKTLQDSIANYEPLKAEISKLLADPDLSRLKATPESTSLQTIIDAMPTQDDRIALGTSLQRVVFARAGVSIDQLAAISNDVAPADSTSTEQSKPGAREVEFSIVISGTYDQIKNAFVSMQNSIRPISVQSIKLTGNKGILKADIIARTYYAESQTTELKEKVEKP